MASLSDQCKLFLFLRTVAIAARQWNLAFQNLGRSSNAQGPLCLQADDGFLEALLSFVVSIPMADIWQDDAWREQQRRLLEAQFGPNEVESLAQNAVLPLQQEAAEGSEDPLMWVQAKELRELQVGNLQLPGCMRQGELVGTCIRCRGRSCR